MSFNRRHAYVAVGVVTLAWMAALRASGVEFAWEELRSHVASFGTVVAVFFAVYTAFDRLLWRIPFLHGWFVERPNLLGTWRVVLRSNYARPGETEPVASIEAFMAVTQTHSTLQMHLMTPESQSRFLASSVRPIGDGTGYELFGVYSNEPETLLRGVRSEIHFGGLALRTHGRTGKPDALTGHYWTDRKTKGTMAFEGRRPDIFTRFEDAQAAFDAEGGRGPDEC